MPNSGRDAMPIIISRVSDGFTELAPAVYEVRVNETLIATFQHNRSDGLAECLRKASEAAAHPRRIGAHD